ncbi:hypothetical protein ACQP00_32115 [Dactylosporangium sp. CS-047395]|uniref:hypothetical protein n=1 Tax=Dactylosporangium sp. CS-047395 TaxID=3239936 RepID=UPI003D8E61E2
MSEDEPPPKQSYTFLIVCGGLALLILIGAAIYIGLDLRSANQVTAEREAADQATASSVAPGCGRHGCAPGRSLPVMFDIWLSAAGLEIVSTGDGQRTGTNVLSLGFPGGGALTAHVSHDKSVLNEVDCVLTANTGSPGTFDSTGMTMLQDCAAATLSAGADSTPRSQTWIGQIVAKPETGRWTCGAVAMQATSDPDHLEIDVFPAPDPNAACGSF